MATWQDVEQIASTLDDVVESSMYGQPAFKVGGRGFIWVRPLRKNDLAELGLDDQSELVVGIHTGDLGEQLALIEEDSNVFFKTAHIDKYPIAFVWLERISQDRLVELVQDAYAARLGS